MSLIYNIVSDEAYKGKDELLTGIADFLRYNITEFNSHAYDFGYRDTIIRYGDWKIASLLCIKSTYLKGRTHDKELKWLDASDHDQIEWAYNYLDDDQNKPILLQGVFFPETIEEKYELILAHLDRLGNVEDKEIGTKKNKGFSERGYTLYSMKKAWSAQKQYESTSKISDGNIKIYKKNQHKLAALMTFSGFTANQMINTSIEQMHDQLIMENIDKAEDT